MEIKSRYTDVNVDLSKNRYTKDVSIARDINAIQQSVLNIVLTSPGERAFQPSFGVGIYNLLFENVGPNLASDIAFRTQKQLEVYEDRVTFEEMTINTSNPFFLDIELRYTINTITDEPISQVVNLQIKKVR